MSSGIIDRDHGWRRMYEAIKETRGVKDNYVKVGILGDGAGGQPHIGGHRNSMGPAEAGTLTVGEIAAIHEFGAPGANIPARSFVRSTFDEKREELQELSETLLGDVLLGELPIEKALGRLGAKLAAEMKKKITTGDGVPPPLAQSTIAAKGSSRPLVDTGRMVNAITWAVMKRGE